MSPFRICQLTDIHITLKQDKTIEGIDVISNFERILQKIIDRSPDLLVLSGDLCFTRNDKKVYAYVREKLEASGLDFIAMSGNHDKSSHLARAFSYEMSGRDLYYTRDQGKYRLIFADSSRHRISESQLDLIARSLETDLQPVLFIHHPPALSGCRFMDRKYPLINNDELREVLSGFKGTIPVFCGHYHTEKEYEVGNLHVYMTPSTYFQIDEEDEQFAVASLDVGWRNITLSDTVETSVHYL